MLLSLGWRRRLILVACLVGCYALNVVVNVGIYRTPSPNVGASVLAFSRLVEAGVAQKVLRAECGTVAFRLCSNLDELDRLEGKRQGFLWESKLPESTDAWRDSTGEYARMNRSIALAAPFAVLAVVASGSMELLLKTSLGGDGADGNWMSYPDDSATVKFIRWMLPADAALFAESRQQRAALHGDILNSIYDVAAIVASLLVLLSFALAIAIGDGLVARLFGLALLFVVANAVVHGGLVGPFARYQVKVAWVAFPLLALAVPRLLAAKRQWSRGG
jgi:hypothetical protein